MTKVLKPWIQIAIKDEVKSAIIVDPKVAAKNKQVEVVQAYEGSIFKKGEILLLKGECPIHGYKIKEVDYLFVDERDVIGAL